MKALLATKMLAGVAIIVPLYLVATRVGLYDTRSALVVVYSATVIPPPSGCSEALSRACPRS
jgi:ABC-type maltose transport system permease subunit